MRKLRRADDLAAEGKRGEEIAADLGVSPATLYNWRRTYRRDGHRRRQGIQGAAQAERRAQAVVGRGRTREDALREVAKGKF